MTKRNLCFPAATLLLAMQSPAQTPTLPQTYSFTATNNMIGPMTLKVSRNGSKELIELTAAGDVRLRLLYDFQAHRIFTVDLNGNGCTTQQYTSAYAPVLHDPIGGAGELAGQLGSLRTISRETVNGIAARVVEAPVSEVQGKMKIWLEEKYGFPVKETMAKAAGPETLLYEMRQISYAPPAAALFAEPAGCARIAGTTNANGGSAEMEVGVTAQGQSHLGGARAANRPAQGGGNVLLGKWEFNGKDGAGVQWRGELAITKLQQNGFDPADYSNECDLSVSSANSGKGMSGPCLYDAGARTFTFAGGEDARKYSLTAVLSPDGKSLTQGRWVEGASGSGGWSAVSKTGAQTKR
jgi:hypothetical protein